MSRKEGDKTGDPNGSIAYIYIYIYKIQLTDFDQNGGLKECLEIRQKLIDKLENTTVPQRVETISLRI